MAFAVWNIVYKGERKAVDVATLLGVPIAVTSLVVAVVTLRKSAVDNGVELARSRAGKLARQVREGESRVWSQLLGADTRRINLTYVLYTGNARVAEAPAAGRTFDDGSATLPDVLEYYRSTQPRRLVVTGAAGAGKTVLALELMLALIDHRGENDPVPVRISLAEWDTDQPLTTLLVRRLTDAYDWPAGMAAGLVAHGMVLPVLDGLDEMDPLLADGTPDPQAPRARVVLEGLNAYQDGREAGPLVLTCRTGHYDALAPVSRLVDAARIAIAPIDTRHAVAYLRDRALDTPRWQPLIDHLGTQPASALATTLSTPWRLGLTATVYHRDGNPSELLRHTDGHDLDQHLLARYLPATIANTHNPHHYRPDEVHRWLHHLTGTTTNAPATDLALHRLWTSAGIARVRIVDLVLTTLVLASVLAPAFLLQGFGSDGTDLVTGFAVCTAFASIVAFRPTPRPNRLRLTREALQGGFAARFWAGFKDWFAVGFGTGVVMQLSVPGGSHIFEYGLGYFAVDEYTIPIRIVIGIGIGFGVGLIGGIMTGLAGGFATGFKDWFRAWFALGIMSGIVNAINIWSLDGYHVGLQHLGMGLFTGLVLGLMGGFIGGFVHGLRGEPAISSTPRAIIRDDMGYGVLIGLIAGILAVLLLQLLVGGDGYGILSELLYSVTDLILLVNVPVVGPMDGPAGKIMVGLVVVLACGFAAAARRYGVFLLCSRGKLPFRLGVFLDWAVTAGLLRYSGPGYQFRHRELQQWLNQHPPP
ncbi:NACHT domain-containing protein [Streptomyces sp. DH18]|uniref:NACHT domain-containing protein n=1 Tax=Streptomyces sp. DH18 TaxID=3040126 RepID=UPI00244178FF|nr:NACHT domain-containing protein [Streptomyces sp. DH18]MDG9688374.1 NACHT domain-containing protein [Streptomyces sp. DH18]